MANDDKRQTLDIPNGTTFEFRDGKLIFGHESDIVIRTNMGGYKFQKIFSKRGSVQVIPPEGVEFDVDEIEALNGDIFFNGRVRARTVRAKTIHFQDGALAGERVEAMEECVLAGQRIDILHVKSPRVVIDQDSTGTCLIIECQNDPGKGRTKGGFRSVDEASKAFDRFSSLTGDSSRAQSMSVSGVAPTPAPRSAAVDTEATMISPARPLAAAATEEFQPPILSGDPGSTQPALPKSSVFRKRT